MRCVVLLTADVPVVRAHRLLTARVVALSEEVHLVGRDLRQVFATSVHCLRYRCETCACIDFVSRRHRGTRDGFQSAQVDVVAVGVGGRSLTVGAENHLLVLRVSRFLVDFGEGTADGLDSISIFYFSHRMFGVCRTDRPAD